MPRKKTFQALREAARLGACDEMPMLPDDIQIQVQLSRNDRPQPFHLICAKDTLLALLSGAGVVEFKGTAVDRFAMKAGDFVYVPAGAPHRIIPAEESVMLRYKPQHAGLEGVSWYCPSCSAELYREVWDTETSASPKMHRQVSGRFAADAGLRTCRLCGTVHPPPTLGFGEVEAAQES